MAKRKRKFFGRNPSPKKLNVVIERQSDDDLSEDEQLQILLTEFAIAGMAVLVNNYNFTQEEAAAWLDSTSAQIKATRSMVMLKKASEERGN